MVKSKRPLGITHQVIAQRLGLGRSTVTRILGQDQNLKVSPMTIRRVFRTAERLNYDFSRIRGIQRREFARQPLNAKARIEVRLSNGNFFDAGEVIVKNVSPKGALLRRLNLPKRVLPIDPFNIDLYIQEGRLKGLQAKGEIVRFETNGRVDLGIRFLELDKHSRARLLRFLDSEGEAL